MKNLREAEEAVSPVIGVILMVAITVVLAAVVYALVADLGNEQATPTPQVSLQGNGSGNYTVLRADRNLLWEDFSVYGCTTIPGGTIDAGDKLGGCDEDAYMTHTATNSIVWRADA